MRAVRTRVSLALFRTQRIQSSTVDFPTIRMTLHESLAAERQKLTTRLTSCADLPGQLRFDLSKMPATPIVRSQQSLFELAIEKIPLSVHDSKTDHSTPSDEYEDWNQSEPEVSWRVSNLELPEPDTACSSIDGCRAVASASHPSFLSERVREINKTRQVLF